MISAMVEFSDERHFNDLKSVQGQLTLANIMTPREQFICCGVNEPALSVIERVSEVFDAVPVVASNDPTDIAAPVLGLLHRDRLPFRNPSAKASDCVDTSALDKAHPSDRNLLVYINGLKGHPVEFVTAENEIVGLVTPYDLERLPVRTALFAQIIDVERLMGDLIKARFPDTADWEARIATHLVGKLRAGLKRAGRNDSVGQPILSVDFAVKLDLLPHCFEGTTDALWVNKESDEIRELRNVVAHGAPFANVTQLPEQVRHLLRLRGLISKRISFLKGQF
ncbi:hypothetical protein [Aliiroseovarius crassostreae]|uniref:hypothetical protein n=1 Tax=Aliiroseovarius crassostreae TaxID=154981 RepID=UPI0022029658|nr:hypothetical protein [Aliiroseovarius crassostreae]UWP90196.1 hypothetical protein K3J57_05875 [Aliiroseovarius crassostreae]